MIEAKNINFYYDSFQALKNINIKMDANTVTAFIGPSGCGKSTFLRIFNRMNDLIPGTKLEGECLIEGKNIYDKSIHVDELRKNVGMVFQKPNPFPKSIFANVAYGLRVNGMGDSKFIAQRVEESLIDAALWDEVKDKLKKSAFELSGGRSEEHTSELQSRPHLVCRLLLEKKKRKKFTIICTCTYTSMPHVHRLSYMLALCYRHTLSLIPSMVFVSPATTPRSHIN